MGQLGRCTCLLPLLGGHCCRIILQFDDQRCSLCGIGKGVCVKDSSFVWQLWCIDCAVRCLEDHTRKNIHAAVCSLDANHSAVFENISIPDANHSAIHWISDSISVDFEEEYYVDSNED